MGRRGPDLLATLSRLRPRLNMQNNNPSEVAHSLLFDALYSSGDLDDALSQAFTPYVYARSLRSQLSDEHAKVPPAAATLATIHRYNENTTSVRGSDIQREETRTFGNPSPMIEWPPCSSPAEYSWKQRGGPFKPDKSTPPSTIW